LHHHFLDVLWFVGGGDWVKMPVLSSNYSGKPDLSHHLHWEVEHALKLITDRFLQPPKLNLYLVFSCLQASRLSWKWHQFSSDPDLPVISRILLLHSKENSYLLTEFFPLSAWN